MSLSGTSHNLHDNYAMSVLMPGRRSQIPYRGLAVVFFTLTSFLSSSLSLSSSRFLSISLCRSRRLSSSILRLFSSSRASRSLRSWASLSSRSLRSLSFLCSSSRASRRFSSSALPRTKFSFSLSSKDTNKKIETPCNLM